MSIAKPGLFQSAIYLTSTQIAGRIIRFLYLLAIARLIGPEDTGIYLYGVALYLCVIGIGQFGQDVFLAQRIGKHGGIPHLILHHSLTLTIFTTLIIAIGLSTFIWISEPSTALRATILCFVGAMMARILVLWVRGAYVAFQRTIWIPKYELIFRGLEAVLGISLIAYGNGLFALALMHFIFWSLEAAFVLRKLQFEFPTAIGFGWRWKYLKKIIAVSSVILITTTAFSLAIQISIILLRLLQPDATFVGQYSIAMQFMTTLLIIPIATTQAFLPRLSRSFSHGDGGKDIITAVKLLGFLALSGAIFCAAYLPLFMTLALGKNYTLASDLFRWLCWVFPPFSILILLVQCLNVIGGRAGAASIMTSVVVLHAVLLIAYIGQSPAIAAIGSMVLAAYCGMAVSLMAAGQKLKVRGQVWWVKPVFVFAATYVVFESGWAPLTVTAPAALATCGLLTWLLRVFDEEDIRAIRRVLGRNPV